MSIAVFPLRPLAAALAVLAFAGCAAESAPALPALAIAPDRVAVAGLSSGGYAAAQAHLALGERIDGVAVISAGPYGCAEGQLELALGPCMAGAPAGPDPERLAALARARMEAGALAPLASLAGDRVLVMHGRLDAAVAPAVGASALGFYRALAAGLPADAEVPVITGALDGDWAHLLPVREAGGDCAASASPWLGRCGVDAAGQVMQALFDVDAAPAEAAAGTLVAFDQRALASDGADPSMADTGWLYLPPACAAGEPCGLLVAFHGCEQSFEAVGEAFVRDAGFNRWADAARVAVLYPQARASFAPLNPKGCWDWWGYTGEAYDTRDGAQPRWLANALDALGAP